MELTAHAGLICEESDVGKINENGECYIFINDVFREMTEGEIFCIIPTFKGRIDTIRRQKNYFVVKGKPNTKFIWELNAKRRMK